MTPAGTLLARRGTKQIVAPGGASYRTEVLADSPYRYWENWAATPVDDAVADAGDLTTVGALMNQTGPLTSGDTKAGTFDGVDDNGSATLDLSDTGVVTVEFWLWWDAFANNDDMALEFTANGAGTAGGFFIDPNGSAGVFDVILTNGGVPSNDNHTWTRPSAGAWHLYQFIFDTSQTAANQIKAYLDGAVWTELGHPISNDLTGNLVNSTLNVMCRNGASLFGAGRMAHLAIYKSTLSAARVSAHWAAR